MITCTNCATENTADSRFCRNCGTALALTCSNCGSENMADSNFCSVCGETLGAPVAPAASASDEAGERRFVTALFADLVGFTTFSESRDPEEVRAMLTRYFDRSREVIERFGGEVDKFIGDAVTAFWGTTQAQEDDAERAVRAALELVDAVEALGEELGIPELAVRAGVLSGETSVGAGGNEKGLVVGDIVNTASRLQSAADPGTVFVGDSTKQLTEKAIRYESVGEHDMKGKSIPVTAWRAIDLLGEIGGKGRSDGLEAPFVGRDDELRMLKDQVHATTRDGHARLVSIVGEAGIGKSRLGWEMQKYTDGLQEEFRWHQGRSPAYGDGVTFWALGEMVRRRAGIAETDEPLKARTKLRTAVSEYVPNPDEQRWIEPRLAGLLGLDEMPAGDKSELYAALRTFFQRVAETGTTVLLFEDLHWADSALLDFINELIDRSPRHPILVVTLARPDLLERQPQWGSRRNGVAVHLGPLTDPQMTELVAGLAPGIPDAATDLVVKQAAGIPLYAVEYVRMLLAGGQLVQDGATFELTESLDALAVPDSLHSVIAARLDRFSEEDRDLIQNASVLGQSFSIDGLAALTGLTESDLEPRLSDLVRQEIFRYEDDPLAPERGQYQFVQGVIREVAYGRLAKAERRERHLRVAEYFESQNDPEMAAIVASHYASAYEAEPDEELAAIALHSLTAAAERAAELKAHEQVLALYEQATAFTTDGLERAPLELIAAHAAIGLDREDEAVAHAERALALYTEGDADQQASIAATDLGNILLDYRRIGDAIEVLEPRYRPDEAAAGLAAALSRAVMMSLEDMPRALQVADSALAAAETSGDQWVLSDALITKGSALSLIGRRKEGTLLLQGGLDIAEEAEFARPQLRAINNLMNSANDDGAKHVGMWGRRGLAAAIRSGNQLEIQQRATQLAWSLAFEGSYDAALALLDEHDVTRDHSGWGLGLPQPYIAWARGETKDTAAIQASIDAVALERSDQQMAANVKEAIASNAAREGRAADAFSMAMDIPMDTWFQAPWIAFSSALSLGDEDRFEAAFARFADWPRPGAKVERFRLYTDAGRAYFAEATAEAVIAFAALVENVEEYGLPLEVNGHRVEFAALVGQDVPEAREAAERAYQWIIDTGSYGYLELWKDGLPEQAVEAAG